MKRLLIVGLCALLLLFSSGLNVFMYNLAFDYYRELNAVRLNPLGLDSYPAQGEALAGRTMVFFGDSRAQDWPAPALAERFQVVNRGIGAQTSSQVALRFDAHVRPLQPDILIVQACVNDLKTVPLFPEQADEIIAACLHNLDTIVTEAREMGSQVILTTVFPVGEPPVQRWLVWSDAIRQAVETVNVSIRLMGGDDIIIFDTYALLVDEGGLLRRDLRRDELHLNAAGYALLNEELTALLLTLEE